MYFYQDAEGRQPVRDWLLGLRDVQAVSRIEARLARLAQGNFGDTEPVGEGVLELRIDWGPGYRVYFARLGQVVVLLLRGGDKRTQDKDIERAKEYFKDYKARTARQRPRGSR
ncbi:MAG: type II toxin-antitoxin system RelE/ParE family toxin [Betaproteobacteria bacterium]|nr:type II toxin-antitoxin system RelE/ParE family toxin [Betaproteobacteria bacterium]